MILTNIRLYFFYLILFFWDCLNEISGCVVNDILDKEFDSKVFRTKNCPIASGKILLNFQYLCTIPMFLSFVGFIKF